MLRGLHFHTLPFEQVKLVRVSGGGILDAVVDLLNGSQTNGQHVSMLLSDENKRQPNQLF